ncbi:MAG: molybdenum ABC transporter ATP-binding protein [Betaproteobacteria bacterium]
MSIHARFRVAFPDFALDVDLDLPGRGVTALFGHSGSGKTTCLRAMAGLERAPGGYLEVNGEVWQDDAKGIFIPTHQRPLGYIFQDAALFPHLSVRKNLEYGRRRIDANKSHIAMDATIELLGIGSLLKRMPEKLSGGEKSRVAMARALLTSPSLLLMDEPLAALDIKRKQEILPYLERLHDELSIPVIYVSHAPDEVARLADHLVLLENGHVVASGPLSETLARTDLPTTFADDAGVVLETTVSGHEADNLSQLDFVDGSLHVGRRKEVPGSRLRCRIHARDVSIALEKPRASSIVNILPATVTAVATTDTPGHVLVQMRVGSTPLLARITERSQRELGIAPGQPVWAQIKGVALLA